MVRVERNWKWKLLSHVRLFVTLWNCPWNSPGQNTGVGSHCLSRESSQSRDQTQVSCIAGRFFTSWATREVQEHWSVQPIPSPGALPDSGVEPGSPALQVDSLPAELSEKRCQPTNPREMKSQNITFKAIFSFFNFSIEIYSCEYDKQW